MKFSIFSIAAVATVVTADAISNPYVAPLPTDRRSPCPMLNALANHGYIPHDGANISLSQLVIAANESINLAEDGTTFVGLIALTGSTTGNPLTFHLDDTKKHGILEHDGSMSRGDIFFGDNYSFNDTIWQITKAMFVEDTISIATTARERSIRMARTAAVNPAANLTFAASPSAIEAALYQSVFGDPLEGNAVTKYVTSLFETERLPYELGWTRPTVGSNLTSIRGLAGRIIAEKVVL